jgi:hypothetical protein
LLSPAIVSANTKTKATTKQGVFAHKGAQTSAVIKFLFVLTTHTGANCNQPAEPAEDWRSDCLREQDLLVGEFCGILGRLHSDEKLAQTNNNAELNKSAKPVTNTADHKCGEKTEKREGVQRREGTLRAETISYRCCRTDRPSCPVLYIYIYVCVCFCFFLFSHKGGANRGKPREEKNIVGALAFGATRRGWSGLLSGPVTVVPERDAGGDRRTRSRVGVGAGRDSREAATVFFVFFRPANGGRRRNRNAAASVPRVGEKNTESAAIKTGSTHQFNPNTYRMKVQD